RPSSIAATLWRERRNPDSSARNWCAYCLRRIRRSKRRPGFLLSRLAQFAHEDRKSTRLNSSHQIISYAVFCLKKKKKTKYSLPTSSHLTLSFFFNAPPTTHIYTLSLHDALPISTIVDCRYLVA